MKYMPGFHSIELIVSEKLFNCLVKILKPLMSFNFLSSRALLLICNCIRPESDVLSSMTLPEEYNLALNQPNSGKRARDLRLDCRTVMGHSPVHHRLFHLSIQGCHLRSCPPRDHTPNKLGDPRVK